MEFRLFVVILLSKPLQCCDCRCAPPHPVQGSTTPGWAWHTAPGIDLKNLCLLGRYVYKEYGLLPYFNNHKCFIMNKVHKYLFTTLLSIILR